MKYFQVYNNKGAADAYVAALGRIGYTPTRQSRMADFLIYDHERRDRLIDLFIGKPIFMTPHTPYSWFIWDGISPIDRATVNFVYGQAAQDGLLRFGYPHRIEVCGFARCGTREFRPTPGRRLLFAPAHPLAVDRKFPRPENAELHLAALRWCVEHKNYFESVTVRHAFDLKDNGFEEYENEPGIIFQKVEKLSAELSVQAIDQADLVLSCATFGFLSMARGVPTLLYGYKNIIPSSRRGFVKNYHLYQDIFEPPYYFEDLTIDQVLEHCRGEDESLRRWKAAHIGRAFDQDKFISVVREFV